MPKSLGPLFAIAVATSACSGASTVAPPTLNAAFATPDEMGRFPTRLSDSDDVRGILDNSVAFATGRDAENGRARAYAGLMPDVTVTAPPPGTAQYAARFEGGIIDRVSVTNNQLSGRNNPLSGDIALTADFAAGTLRGNGDSLMVRGVLDGSTLTGTVTYRDIPGQIIGLAGGDRIVAAFQGQGTNVVYAGGLVGNSVP